VKALAVHGNALAFVTVHPEGQPTAVYLLDPENHELTEKPLPAGGQSLLATEEGLWVGATDSRLYHLGARGAAKAVGATLPAPPVALAPLSGGRLAVAAGARVLVVGRGDGKVTQELELPEAATCLAADPTGQWLAAGTAKGTVVVFECETAPELRQSDSAALHEAAVTVLWFEADDLRFISAGADQKLLSTHARGRLEAEDRGRGANHEKPVTAIVGGPAQRFLTGSLDATLKSWPPGKAGRPVTYKENLKRVVALAVVPVHGKPHVVAACEDNGLRFIQIDEEGKFGEEAGAVFGVAAWARYELGQSDPRRREEVLKKLAGFADADSVERIASRMAGDADHALRLLACKLLAGLRHPRVVPALEKALAHKDEAVRVAAFDGLRKHAGAKELRPLELALKAGKADVGVKAVEALQELAAGDDQAMARLVGALQERTAEVRRSALAGLEKVHGKDSPEASLAALAAPHADLRRLALVRLYQRKLLDAPRVEDALRRRGEDPDPEVRRVAFLLSLYTRELLLAALRKADAELERQLGELESGNLPAMEEKPVGVAQEEEAEEEDEDQEEAGDSDQDEDLGGDEDESFEEEGDEDLDEGDGEDGGEDAAGDAAAQARARGLPPGLPGLPVVADPNALLQKLDEMGRRGVIPAEVVQRLQHVIRSAGAMPGAMPGNMLSMISAQLQAFARHMGKAGEPDEDADGGDE
jgi:ParB family chromosome partitioning protein